MPFGVRSAVRIKRPSTRIVPQNREKKGLKMNNQPELTPEDTVLRVEKQKRFGRVDYSAVNSTAVEFLSGFKQKSFTLDDLKFIKSLGYKIMIMGTDTVEF